MNYLRNYPRMGDGQAKMGKFFERRKDPCSEPVHADYENDFNSISRYFLGQDI